MIISTGNFSTEFSLMYTDEVSVVKRGLPRTLSKSASVKLNESSSEGHDALFLWHCFMFSKFPQLPGVGLTWLEKTFAFELYTIPSYH